MYKIQTLNKISPIGLDIFDNSKYTCGDDIENPEAILVRSASMHDMELSDSTLAIARAGAGVNNIPIDKCSENGIVVFNTPGANANAVKELVICSLLLTSRKIVAGIDWCKTLKGNGAEVSKLVEKGKSAFVGPEIMGKKLGVIGLGAIGVLVANAAVGLGMNVYGYDPYLSVNAAWNLSRSIHHATSLDTLFAECDYITLHVPLNDATRSTVNAESIKSMKDGVRILNFSRGELVDSAALLEALSTGKVSAYATDFPSDDLIGESGVIAIPHLGASTPESEDNCAVMAVHQIIDYLENGNIKNSVNLPEISLPRGSGVRICVMHKNVPTILNKVTSSFAQENVNIDNMLNKSKGSLAYTILDAYNKADFDDSALDAIKAIDGVINVRVFK